MIASLYYSIIVQPSPETLTCMSSPGESTESQEQLAVAERSRCKIIYPGHEKFDLWIYKK
jgi:hypothetical protein